MVKYCETKVWFSQDNTYLCLHSKG